MIAIDGKCYCIYHQAWAVKKCPQEEFPVVTSSFMNNSDYDN